MAAILSRPQSVKTMALPPVQLHAGDDLIYWRIYAPPEASFTNMD